MARKRPEPSLTELLASWPRQRQKARGGTSVVKLNSLSISTASFADTLNSFNYRLQNRRKRRKSRRNDTEARLPFALWPPAFEVGAIKTVFVYRCTMKHSYSETDRVHPRRAFSCTDHHSKSFYHEPLLMSYAESYHCTFLPSAPASATISSSLAQIQAVA